MNKLLSFLSHRRSIYIRISSLNIFRSHSFSSRTISRKLWPLALVRQFSTNPDVPQAISENQRSQRSKNSILSGNSKALSISEIRDLFLDLEGSSSFDQVDHVVVGVQGTLSCMLLAYMVQEVLGKSSRVSASTSHRVHVSAVVVRINEKDAISIANQLKEYGIEIVHVVHGRETALDATLWMGDYCLSKNVKRLYLSDNKQSEVRAVMNTFGKRTKLEGLVPKEMKTTFRNEMPSHLTDDIYIIRPFLQLTHEQIEATSEHFNIQEHSYPGGLCAHFTHLTLNQLEAKKKFDPVIALNAMQSLSSLMNCMRETTDDLLRRCVLQVSPLGYVVLRRSSFFRENAIGGQGVAIRALIRVIEYVGAPKHSPTLFAASRLYETTFKEESKAKSVTLGGVWFIPVTRRKQFEQITGLFMPKKVKLKKRKPDSFLQLIPNGFVNQIVIAAPERNSVPKSHIKEVKLDVGESCFFDDRFIVSVEKVNDTHGIFAPETHAPNFESNLILQARLARGVGSKAHHLIEGYEDSIHKEFTVRRLNSITDMVVLKQYNKNIGLVRIPQECRNVPVFVDRGGLVAVPHFGYNNRSDLRFTAKFMPKYRTSFPPDLDILSR